MAMNFGKLDFSTSFNPTKAFPLDARCYFESLTAAETAAATAEAAGSSNTVYFFGQQIAVVEEKVATLYIIQENAEGKGELVEVGSKTLGDDKTITLENGTLSLKEFGKSYYKYVAAVYPEEGETIPAHYEKVEGFKSGLQPQVTTEEGQLVLAWYEPNPTTVEGLEAEISALSTTVSDLSGVVGNADSGLVKKVNDNATAIEGKQDALTAGDGVKIEDNVVSIDLSTLILDGGSAEDWAETPEITDEEEITE